MMYFVYVLRSLKDFKNYVGFTENLDRRFEEHNSGLVKSTRNRSPFKLLYSETFKTKKEALKKEKFFKTGKGREYLKTLLE